MRTFALIIAGIAALALPISSAAAETVVIKKGHHHRHMDRPKKVVVIKHDRGHHYGWRNHHAEGSKVIIKRD